METPSLSFFPRLAGGGHAESKHRLHVCGGRANSGHDDRREGRDDQPIGDVRARLVV